MTIEVGQEHHYFDNRLWKDLLAAANELSLDISIILESLGLDATELGTNNSHTSLESFSSCLNLIAEVYEVPHFGLVVGKHKPPLEYGPLTNLFKYCPTFGAVLFTSPEHYQLFIQDVFWDTEVVDNYAILTRLTKAQRVENNPQLNLMSITHCFNTQKSLLGAKWKPMRINLSHKYPESTIKICEDFFRTPIACNQPFDSIIFPASLLTEKIPTANSVKLKALRSYLDKLALSLVANGEDDFVVKVRNQIRKAMIEKKCTITNISREMSIHPKALQRKLSSKNLSFKQLLDQERVVTAKIYLKDPDITIDFISEMIGYRNVSAFSRAFTRLTGVPPSRWRSQNAECSNDSAIN